MRCFDSSAGCGVAATAPCRLRCTTDFGESYGFAIPQCIARIENSADRPLHLKVEPAPPNGVVAAVTVTVPAKGSAEVPLRAAVGPLNGKIIKYFAVYQQDSEAAPLYLEARGFAMSALDDVRPRVEFGSVEAALEPMKEVLLSSHAAAHFRIERILEKPAQLDAQISPDGHTLRVSVRTDAEWGVLNDAIKLAIDKPHQKEAWVSVHAEIHGDIAPDANPVSLGLLAACREQMLQLTSLRNKNGGTFRVGALRVEGIEGTAETAACSPAAEDCKALRLKVFEWQAERLVRGKVIVDLPDQQNSLPIEFQGFLMGPQISQPTPASSAGEATPAATHEPARAATTATQESSPESESGRAVSQAEALPPPGTGPLLKWNVLDERVVHGYQVFRANAETGPFVLLNAPRFRSSPIANRVLPTSGATVRPRRARLTGTTSASSTTMGARKRLPRPYARRPSSPRENGTDAIKGFGERARPDARTGTLRSTWNASPAAP